MATTASPSLLPALPPKARTIPAAIRSSPLAEPLPRPSWRTLFRAATVLGLVGAGGIGFKIQVSMRLFQYHDLTTYVILLIVMVTVIDRVSAYLRARIT